MRNPGKQQQQQKNTFKITKSKASLKITQVQAIYEHIISVRAPI